MASDSGCGDKQLADLCVMLEKEPLYHVSLGSKELFHSNFLAWFADSFPELAAAVFEPWAIPMKGAQPARSERETKHVDLILHLPGLAPIAVENKVFSVPNEEQLGDVSDVLAKMMGHKTRGGAYTSVLLSLMSPGWATYLDVGSVPTLLCK
jgi:hypothetical protein